MILEELSSRAGNFIAGPEWADGVFEALGREIFAFQFKHNLAYRAFCESRGVSPRMLKSLDQIPAIITTAFKDLEMTVLPPHLRSAVFHSSGTTEQRPSQHFHAPVTLDLYHRSLLRWFQPHVLPDVSRANFLVLTPRSPQAPQSSLVHMFESLAAEFSHGPPVFCGAKAQDGSWSLNFEMVQRACAQWRSENIPVVICGTAFSFVHLCDFLAEHETVLSFPNGSRAFETGGYKGRSRSVPKVELHAMISNRLSIPASHIISEYGMSELSSQAYDRITGRSEERFFHFPPWTRVTVVSPETGGPVGEGETGLLRVLDLANVGSVMAIQTEDLARRRGAGFELLGRAERAEARGCSLHQVHA